MTDKKKIMLGLQSPLICPTILSFSFSKPLTFPSILFKTQIRPLESPSRFLIFAADGSNNNNNNNADPITKEAKQKEQDQQQQPKGFFNGDGGGGGDDLGRDRRPMFNFKLGDLLNPDPDNIVAIGLAGLLTWASVLILGQLFFISLAILLAALKYSFIAALLIFILITLL
ncbi:uncharacterized protein LOC119990231 [Tripterygium wilfordii]|uniref:uncharacterized protein LOC119990231 n=1 Tax=Tripterygium wilfordii TaxID=458696 RepID=UPI0018F7ED0D|nr:uncharacterized protein LOC119990231 [Tripterygium wilfordii]